MPRVLDSRGRELVKGARVTSERGAGEVKAITPGFPPRVWVRRDINTRMCPDLQLIEEES